MELVRLPCGIHMHKHMVREPSCFQLSSLFKRGDDKTNAPASMIVSTMINKLHGQPQSYDKKCVSEYCSYQLTPRAD